MPRKGRGGARTGRPQQAYANRSDMNAPPDFSGQPYGTEVAQQAIQQASQPQPAGPDAVRMAAQNHAFPGGLPAMNAESAYPQEPLTSGMAMGAGPGPESLRLQMPQNNQTPQQADLENMRKALPGLEALADLGGTSKAFSSYVSELRGQIRGL